MIYTSTRDNSVKVISANAIIQGISKDGGLFVPREIPRFSADEIKAAADMDYTALADAVFAKFLTDFTPEEISKCTLSAYSAANFPAKTVGLHELSEGVNVLELWHGPTCAFKDMALQILPHFLSASMKKINLNKKIIILVATSGDTGKAALEGFKDVKGTEIMVFYPENGVSPMQKAQMVTQEGGNVRVCALRGNFDDCQNGVKAIFTDGTIRRNLAENSMMFSSANSINWGRLAPQIVYYIYAYSRLLAAGKIAQGDEVNIAVPTGNFGNILAAYYAKKMGLPVKKMICASNINNVLTDFINTGVYDRNREFFTTSSPSMDILISSNLERLLYHFSGNSDEAVRDWFGQLQDSGRYEVGADIKAQLQSEFYAGCCNEADTAATVRGLFEKNSYLCDTHTAVAVKVYNDYCGETGDKTPVIIASTANPYKFGKDVLAAIGGKCNTDEYETVECLNKKSGMEIPKPLLNLGNKEILHKDVINTKGMREYVVRAIDN